MADRRLAKGRVTKIGFPEVHPGEFCRAEIRFAEVRSAEVRFVEVHTVQVRAPEVLAPELRLLQIRMNVGIRLAPRIPGANTLLEQRNVLIVGNLLVSLSL